MKKELPVKKDSKVIFSENHKFTENNNLNIIIEINNNEIDKKEENLIKKNFNTTLNNLRIFNLLTISNINSNYFINNKKNKNFLSKKIKFSNHLKMKRPKHTKYSPGNIRKKIIAGYTGFLKSILNFINKNDSIIYDLIELKQANEIFTKSRINNIRQKSIDNNLKFTKTKISDYFEPRQREGFRKKPLDDEDISKILDLDYFAFFYDYYYSFNEIDLKYKIGSDRKIILPKSIKSFEYLIKKNSGEELYVKRLQDMAKNEFINLFEIKNEG